MAGRLLLNELMSAMTSRHPLDVPVAGRPWVAPGYGLGMMIGDIAGGDRFAGHTGGGPGSVVAVYHALSGGPARTAAIFLPGDDQGAVESGCFALLSR